MVAQGVRAVATHCIEGEHFSSFAAPLEHPPICRTPHRPSASRIQPQMVLAFPPLYFFSAVVPLLARWLLHQRRVPPLRSSVRLGRQPRQRRGFLSCAVGPPLSVPSSLSSSALHLSFLTGGSSTRGGSACFLSSPAPVQRLSPPRSLAAPLLVAAGAFPAGPHPCQATAFPGTFPAAPLVRWPGSRMLR